MQVITLSPTELDKHAARLAEAVKTGSTCRFDAIVAVRRGGSLVCDAFCRHFPAGDYGVRFDVTLQRPSTQRKGGGMSRILKRLPVPILNAMRIMEAAILGILRNLKKNVPLPDVRIPEGLVTLLTGETGPAILLIDDAIDSGDTLSAIADAIKKTNPNTTIIIAVITETTVHPRIRANYTLYRNRTLIRFPWSNDYKGN